MSDAIGQLAWRWEDLAWRERVGGHPDLIVREALRRAVDLRDRPPSDSRRSRQLFLVDVLNHLCEVLAVDTERLWDLA
jgi:hypothetical protein